MLDGVVKVDRFGLACLQCDCLLLVFNIDCGLLFCGSLVLHSYCHLYSCLVGRHIGCGYKHPVLSNMQGGHRLQPHMTIDARARVPAAVGLLGVVNLHYDLVEALILK